MEERRDVDKGPKERGKRGVRGGDKPPKNGSSYV